MKKILIGITIVLLAVVFVGCGDSSSSNEKEEDTSKIVKPSGLITGTGTASGIKVYTNGVTATSEAIVMNNKIINVSTDGISLDNTSKVSYYFSSKAVYEYTGEVITTSTSITYSTATSITLSRTYVNVERQYTYDGTKLVGAKEKIIADTPYGLTPNSSNYTYEYDINGNLIKINKNGKLNTTLKYSESGALVKYERGSDTRSYSYDIFGKLIKIVDVSNENTYTTEYLYLNGKVEKIVVDGDTANAKIVKYMGDVVIDPLLFELNNIIYN